MYKEKNSDIIILLEAVNLSVVNVNELIIL